MTKDSYFASELGIGIPDLSSLKEFFETYCEDEIYELLNNYPDKQNICIDLNAVRNFSVGLEQAIINKYEKTIGILKTALLEVQAIKGSNKEFTEKDIDLQVCNMPAHYKKLIRDLTNKDLNKLICIEGFVKARAFPKPKIIKAAFQCLRCGHITYVDEPDTKFEEPFAGCEEETCGKKGPFKLLIDESTFIDFQAIKLQEFPDSMKGTKPYDITVQFKNELTGQLEAGDRVSIIGVLNPKQMTVKDGKSCLFDYILSAVSIEKLDAGFDEYVLTEKDKEEAIELSKDPKIQNKISQSIAPSIYGYDEVKEALALQLFSGVRKKLPDETVLRGNINIAVIGDPGTSKSLLVRRTVSLSPRGVFTSGRSVSAAGLTAAVVKDELSDGWTLEGGAAVMASGGILGIDEIGHAKEEDKSALHEVMEQGTVTISKAGILATLKAECSVLAAGNPKKGYFEEYEPLPEQIGIAPALWSRFDMIFTVFDKADSYTDNVIAERVLTNHRIGGIIQNKEKALQPQYSEADLQREAESTKAPIETEKLKKYIAYARSYIFPVAGPKVTKAIKDFYTAVRSMKLKNNNKPVPITVRSLEAIQRLTEASARMRLSNEITMKDVEFAKKLIVKSLQDIGYNEEGTLDACLLLGLPSSSQQTNIKRIKKYSSMDKTEEEIIELMRQEHNVNDERTIGYIKHLMEKEELIKTPDGKLRILGIPIFSE